jgi:hypothetical protein
MLLNVHFQRIPYTDSCKGWFKQFIVFSRVGNRDVQPSLKKLFKKLLINQNKFTHAWPKRPQKKKFDYLWKNKWIFFEFWWSWSTITIGFWFQFLKKTTLIWLCLVLILSFFLTYLTYTSWIALQVQLLMCVYIFSRNV